MNKGKVTVAFMNGDTFAAIVSVGDAQAIHQHTEWRNIVEWWVRKDSENCSIGWEDGSMMLLARSKIVGITLEPVTCLEID